MTGVRMFGDLDDPQSEIAQFVAKNGHRLTGVQRGNEHQAEDFLQEGMKAMTNGEKERFCAFAASHLRAAGRGD